MLGYLPTWAIYFAVYDSIKSAFGEPPMGTPRERLYPAAQVKGYQPVMREHPWSLHILSAMVAGGTSTLCTNPLWVIKTRFMVRVFNFLWEACTSLHWESKILIFFHPIRSCADSIQRRSPISAYAGRCCPYL